MRKIDLPPFYLLGMLLLTYLLVRLVPIWHFGAYIGNIWALLLMLLGLGLIIWAIITLRRAQTPIYPRQKPEKLVRNGPFSFSRNPIYTGMALIGLGWGLYWGDIVGMLPVFLFYLLITKRFILPEEQILRDKFGSEAEQYIADIRRW